MPHPHVPLLRHRDPAPPDDMTLDDINRRLADEAAARKGTEQTEQTPQARGYERAFALALDHSALWARLADW